MFSKSSFRVIEHRYSNDGLHLVYASSSQRSLCLSDASRFAAALSFVIGAHIQVLPITSGETYSEWWFAGRLDREPDIEIVDGKTLPEPAHAAVGERSASRSIKGGPAS